MKIRKIAVAAATLIVVLSASLVVAEPDVHKSFDLLKGMEGNWAGKDSEGRAASSDLPANRRWLGTNERDSRT
jgi:hypothetical protein